MRIVFTTRMPSFRSVPNSLRAEIHKKSEKLGANPNQKKSGPTNLEVCVNRQYFGYGNSVFPSEEKWKKDHERRVFLTKIEKLTYWHFDERKSWEHCGNYEFILNIIEKKKSWEERVFVTWLSKVKPSKFDWMNMLPLLRNNRSKSRSDKFFSKSPRTLRKGPPTPQRFLEKNIEKWLLFCVPPICLQLKGVSDAIK